MHKNKQKVKEKSCNCSVGEDVATREGCSNFTDCHRMRFECWLNDRRWSPFTNLSSTFCSKDKQVVGPTLIEYFCILKLNLMLWTTSFKHVKLWKRNHEKRNLETSSSCCCSESSAECVSVCEWVCVSAQFALRHTYSFVPLSPQTFGWNVC